MQIVINIPDEQIKKSLEESRYIIEDEGEQGFVNIVMHYANERLEFVDVSRKTDFYSCEYKILPEGHGDLIDKKVAYKKFYVRCLAEVASEVFAETPIIIKADKGE